MDFCPWQYIRQGLAYGLAEWLYATCSVEVCLCHLVWMGYSWKQFFGQDTKNGIL